MLVSWQSPSRVIVRRAMPRPATRSRNRYAGFTLLETFIALVILGFALAGLAMLMLGNVQTGRLARRFTAAGAQAQQKLEDLRAAGYTNADTAATVCGGTGESLTEGPTSTVS